MHNDIDFNYLFSLTVCPMKVLSTYDIQSWNDSLQSPSSSSNLDFLTMLYKYCTNNTQNCTYNKYHCTFNHLTYNIQAKGLGCNEPASKG